MESALALSRSMFAISLIEMARSSGHISSFIMHTVKCHLEAPPNYRFIYLYVSLRTADTFPVVASLPLKNSYFWRERGDDQKCVCCLQATCMYYDVLKLN